MMLCQAILRSISVVRFLSTSLKVHASHYDVLGITPRATQNDIKSAYYKLSKIHHPDISSDETSAKKFRAITEAYEVLGNIKLKKMYDKGLMVGRENTTRMEYRREPEPTDPTLKFYKSRLQRHVAPTMDGKTPIYNFDAWSKSHYGDLFQQKHQERETLKKQQTKQVDHKIASRQEALMYIIFAIGSLFIVLVAHGTEDFDKINTNSNKKQDKT